LMTTARNRDRPHPASARWSRSRRCSTPPMRWKRRSITARSPTSGSS
jgi:hypothetical protein